MTIYGIEINLLEKYLTYNDGLYIIFLACHASSALLRDSPSRCPGIA